MVISYGESLWPWTSPRPKIKELLELTSECNLGLFPVSILTDERECLKQGMRYMMVTRVSRLDSKCSCTNIQYSSYAKIGAGAKNRQSYLQLLIFFFFFFFFFALPVLARTLLVCTLLWKRLETKIDSGNNVSRMAKLRKVEETCTRYMNVSGNTGETWFLVLLKPTGVKIIRERYRQRGESNLGPWWHEE